MSVTPESTKTVSLTGEKAGEGPTPKNGFKKPTLTQKQYFMSPTDAMVSPCTQKLQTSRRFPWKPLGRRAVHLPQATSKLADKENEKRAVVSKMPSLDEETSESAQDA